MFNNIMSTSTSSSSIKSDHSQLVDLIIEDHEAEEIERVRARKEGDPAWNEVSPKHFVLVNTNLWGKNWCWLHTRRAYPDDHQTEEVREGYEPQKHDQLQPHDPENIHNIDRPFTIDDNDDTVGDEVFEGNSEDTTHWHQREYTDTEDVDEQSNRKPVYGSFPEERHIWGK